MSEDTTSTNDNQWHRVGKEKPKGNKGGTGKQPKPAAAAYVNPTGAAPLSKGVYEAFNAESGLERAERLASERRREQAEKARLTEEENIKKKNMIKMHKAEHRPQAAAVRQKPASSFAAALKTVSVAELEAKVNATRAQFPSQHDVELITAAKFLESSLQNFTVDSPFKAGPNDVTSVQSWLDAPWAAAPAPLQKALDAYVKATPISMLQPLMWELMRDILLQKKRDPVLGDGMLVVVHAIARQFPHLVIALIGDAIAEYTTVFGRPNEAFPLIWFLLQASRGNVLGGFYVWSEFLLLGLADASAASVVQDRIVLFAEYLTSLKVSGSKSTKFSTSAPAVALLMKICFDPAPSHVNARWNSLRDRLVAVYPALINLIGSGSSKQLFTTFLSFASSTNATLSERSINALLDNLDAPAINAWQHVYPQEIDASQIVLQAILDRKRLPTEDTASQAFVAFLNYLVNFNRAPLDKAGKRGGARPKKAESITQLAQALLELAPKYNKASATTTTTKTSWLAFTANAMVEIISFVIGVVYLYIAFSYVCERGNFDHTVCNVVKQVSKTPALQPVITSPYFTKLEFFFAKGVQASSQMLLQISDFVTEKLK